MRFAIAVAAAWSIQAIALAADDDEEATDTEFCQRIAKFADSATRRRPVEITLQTEWGAEMAVYCTHDRSAAGRRLCRWLPLHVSREFMEINVSRVETCLWQEARDEPVHVFTENREGKIRSHEARFVAKNVWLEIEFSTTPASGKLPFLTIRAGRL